MTPNNSQLTQAKSFAEWTERSQRLAPALLSSIQQGLQYKPEPSDVFVSPMCKCGTTWLQQIIHTLKTRGDMEFEDLLHVTPWLEMAKFLEQDVYAQPRGGFRVIKSHLTWEAIPKGGRYVVSFRDPVDALLSDYNFVNGYSWEAGAVSLDEHAKGFMHDREGNGGWETNYWRHLVSWWRQRRNPKVLLLAYEDMKLDLAAAVRAIATFLNINLDEELLRLTLYHASRDFMLTNKRKFSGNLLQEAMAKQGYAPPSENISMVKKVRSNKQSLPEHIQKEMDDCWSRTVIGTTGMSSYGQLIAALRNN